MLGVKTYSREYVEQCRARVAADVAAYRDVAAAAAKDREAMQNFEGRFFNEMVILLDALFVHRLRVIEGKDGNSLNEVRLLCNSMLLNGNQLTADKSIKLIPAKSVLKYEYGDEIRLDEASFARLCDAFFAEIENKFV